jgi:hypothetical protein
MSKRKVIFLLTGVAVLLLIATYAYLGGFKPVNLEITSCRELNLVGIEYLGTPQDETIGAYFREVEASRGDKPLHTIYFIEPSGKRDTLQVFIGYESKEPKLNLSSPWSYQTVECAQVIVAKLEMNRFVMPGPGKTKRAIQDFAKENGLTLKGIFIDKIISSNYVEVWAPIHP